MLHSMLLRHLRLRNVHVRNSHLRNLLFAGLLAASGVATAQSLPRPAEFYFDQDAGTASPVVALEGRGDELVQRLLKHIGRDPRANAETAQLAHLAMAGGREDLGRELYRRVLARLQVTDRLHRTVLWNYGWDLYRAGHAEEALAQWQELMATRSLAAQWMPQTLALALWSLDRRDEAAQWYAAAVRTEPQLWGTADQFDVLLPQWSAQDRATLAQVHAAWAARPPAY